MSRFPPIWRNFFVSPGTVGWVEGGAGWVVMGAPWGRLPIANWKMRREKIVCVYIQVQKVYVLYLFWGNPEIIGLRFLKFERICNGDRPEGARTPPLAVEREIRPKRRLGGVFERQ